MSSDPNESDLTKDLLLDSTRTVLELEEGEIENEEPTISHPRLKASIRESKSSSKKHKKSKNKHKHQSSSISSDSDSSDEEESRRGWWNKKKLHVSSSQLLSSETIEENSSDEEYIEKLCPDFATIATMRYNKRNSRKRKNKKNKKKHHEASNDSPLSSSSKEDKKKLYPCKSYIAFGKCDDIKCQYFSSSFHSQNHSKNSCIHAPLNKEEELHRFIQENEEFFSNAFKKSPNSPINPSLLQFLSQKFASPKSQNSLHLNLNKDDPFARPMPPRKFFPPQLPHNHYPMFNPSPTHTHNPYSFPIPQVFSPQNQTFSPGFPHPQVYANPSIYFEFNMQQNLTYLPQNPHIFAQQYPLNKPHNTLLPSSIISPNNQQCQSEIVHIQFGKLSGEGAMNIEAQNKVSGFPRKIQSTTPNCFLASKDLTQAPGMMGRRRSSMDTATGSETHEAPHEKGISPEQDAKTGDNQEKEEEVKKAKTAEKITKLVELFKAKQINKQKHDDGEKNKKETPEKPSMLKILSGKEKKNEAENMFKDWEEISPKKNTEKMKSKFDNESANDELLKKIKSALSESPTSSGSGNVKDLVNMYLKMSKNLIMENNSIH